MSHDMQLVPTADGTVKTEPSAPSRRFFSPDEHATANALCERLLALEPDCPVPVVARIDARLAGQESVRRPAAPDGEAWRHSLAALKADAVDRFQSPFAVLDGDRRDRLILRVRDLGPQAWHEMRAEQVWGLWTGYACTAFYSHPFAWNGAGFRA
ncbi:gluconate 2-dehydrogenase subunit 3 family protein [Actinospica robiniae]|uniref:gluconate 2-dehydrogenase subunit 3 family protein n=1 Tax=Actinospica robiniae TaxID=304901 RepID=UPI00146F95B0|nr:gluconate 2-dehydrogenase subunit 3 family protein [Actinospica robiniae]